MDQKQTRDHLQILSSRVNALQQELDVAFRDAQLADNRIRSLQEGLDTINENRVGRTQELEARFELEFAECKRQVKLAQEVLAKKKEERQALLTYLKGLDLNERSFEDLRDYDWASLRKLAENIHQPSEQLVIQNQKAEELNEGIELARSRLSALYEVVSSTKFVGDRMTKSLETLRSHFNEWSRFKSSQERRISKIKSDNERLHILIRQCIATNEPMSEYITKNIQAKCQSFVNSENSHELVEGLNKFRARQERIVKLLQYKDNKLGSETNKLQVAKDQTHDQVKFYLNMLNERRNASRVRITTEVQEGLHQTQQQTSITTGDR